MRCWSENPMRRTSFRVGVERVRPRANLGQPLAGRALSQTQRPRETVLSQIRKSTHAHGYNHRQAKQGLPFRGRIVSHGTFRWRRWRLRRRIRWRVLRWWRYRWRVLWRQRRVLPRWWLWRIRWRTLWQPPLWRWLLRRRQWFSRRLPPRKSAGRLPRWRELSPTPTGPLPARPTAA